MFFLKKSGFKFAVYNIYTSWGMCMYGISYYTKEEFPLWSIPV